MTPPKWRVYYDDGSTWHSSQGLDGIPAYGVLVILQCVPFETGGEPKYFITHQCPYYMLHDGVWLHSYENDIIDHLVNGLSVDKLLVGRMVSKQVFGDVYKKAVEDKNAENL